MLAPLKNEAYRNVGLKSEIFGYLGIIDSELFPVHGLSP